MRLHQLLNYPSERNYPSLRNFPIRGFSINELISPKGEQSKTGHRLRPEVDSNSRNKSLARKPRFHASQCLASFLPTSTILDAMGIRAIGISF